jgi:drug/metabolite transporter (DMT)-like permease
VRYARCVSRSPLATGGVLALASAAAFGATTPLVQRFGRGVGPFMTATLLYGGAALLFALAPSARTDASLRRQDAPRLAAVALLGAVIAPMALAWGLQRTSGITASLLLNLEAAATVTLARVFWRESIGLRVGTAVVVMVAGGSLLVAQGVGGPALDGPMLQRASGVAGSLAVVGATLAWAADNVVGRPLADRSPRQVVLAKGGIGATVSLLLACALGEGFPPWRAAEALAVCGAAGYGASLHLYLRAQRLVGAARTGSIFAAAPFLGAALAWALGERLVGAATLWAAAFCALGVWLHLTESHEHEHTHEGIEHEHAHRHDDGHHSHHHDAYPGREHSHSHRHEAVTHAHAHGPDIHHGHNH